MADFIQLLDPSKLVFIEAVLSFATSVADAPVYNLPLFLFGIYAQESQDAVQSLKTFSGFLVLSIVYDIIWMSRHDQNWFLRLLTIVILLLKIPTILSFLTALRQRGAQFSGLGFRSNDLAGATVWSMPGGFTSSGDREGYQPVDEPAFAAPPRPPSQPAPSTQPNAPGAYQAV